LNMKTDKKLYTLKGKMFSLTVFFTYNQLISKAYLKQPAMETDVV